jgi:hypothetical protein
LASYPSCLCGEGLIGLFSPGFERVRDDALHPYFYSMRARS